MRTLWKFPVTGLHGEPVVLEMPRGATVVRFAMQCGQPTLWAEVDPDQECERREFAVLGTGHPIADGAAYVGSWEQGPFVWHLYDMQHAIDLPAEIERLPQDAINAYRLLRREGFTLQAALPGFAPTWAAPDDEPTTMEQTMALATLAEHGLGALAEA